MMPKDVYDTIIIGAGPAGLAVANTLHKNNINYIVFERNYIGSNIAKFPVSMTFFSDRRLLEIDGFPLAIPEEKPSREQYLTYIYHFSKTRNLKIQDYTEVVNLIKPEYSKSGFFEIEITKRNFQPEVVKAKTVVVACGAFDDPRFLKVEGEELSHVSHYFTEVFPYLNHSVLVVGSGNSAVEAALKLYRSGCTVGLSYRSEKLSATKIKYWMYPDIQKRLEKNEIKNFPLTTVSKIEPGMVKLASKDGRLLEEKYDFVLAMTGYNPPVSFLKKTGINLIPETNVPVHDPGNLETGIPGLFVAGVITGGNISGKVFIENSRDHGEMILPRLTEYLK